MSFLAWIIFIAAAILEVGGDAIVRKGQSNSNLAIILCGCLMLSFYGLVVNLVNWDFSRLLGVYVAVFALISILWGRFLFQETVPVSTWIGLAVIITGGLIIQSGS